MDTLIVILACFAFVVFIIAIVFMIQYLVDFVAELISMRKK